MRDFGESAGIDRRGLLAGAGAAVAASALGAAPALAGDEAARVATVAMGTTAVAGRSRARTSASSSTRCATLPLEEQLKGLAQIGYKTVEHAGFGDAHRGAVQGRAAQVRAQGDLGPPGHPAAVGRGGVAQAGRRRGHGRAAQHRQPGEPDHVLPARRQPGEHQGPDDARPRGRPTPPTSTRRARSRASPACGSASTTTSGSGSALEDDTPLTGFDILIADTDPRLVHFEVDLYWAWFAHRDPVAPARARRRPDQAVPRQGHAVRQPRRDVRGRRHGRDRLRPHLQGGRRPAPSTSTSSSATTRAPPRSPRPRSASTSSAGSASRRLAPGGDEPARRNSGLRGGERRFVAVALAALGAGDQRLRRREALAVGLGELAGAGDEAGQAALVAVDVLQDAAASSPGSRCP